MDGIKNNGFRHLDTVRDRKWNISPGIQSDANESKYFFI